jgi:serine/threonine-protein kinase
VSSRNSCDANQLDLFLQERLPAESLHDVEAHLLSCASCRGRLDVLAGGPKGWAEVRTYLSGDDAEPAGAAPGPGTAAATDLGFLEPSDQPESLGRLGCYEVLEVLGHGGMGVVLKAFDPALHRPVAIKVLAAEFAARGAARKRFAREARAAAAVVHEHVVPVHAVDADATPPYLVMAFIPGESLQERIDRTGPLELKEVLRIGMQTAAGLAAAHAQGLVHRDVKPANIMLEHGIERVRITDFGLARAVDDASVTQSGTVTGTPQYMAPEQANGGAVDQRADLFALGSTLYAMCTGHAPFRGSSGWSVLRQVCETEPRSIRTINPDMPAWLEGIIRKLHAKDPERRLQSAAEVADLLGRCLAHIQQPDRQPLPRPAVELGRLVPGPGRPGQKRWHTAAALAAVIMLCSLLLFLPRSEPKQTAGDQEQKAVETAPSASLDLSEWTQAEDELRWRPAQVRQLLDRLQRSLEADPTSAEDGAEQALAGVRWRAEQLSQGLAQTAISAADPVDAELARIRRRLEMIRKDVGPERE